MHCNFRAKLLFVLIVFLLGCTRQPQPNLSVYRMLAATLNHTNAALANTNRDLQKSIEYNYNGLVKVEKLVYWLPKCKLIQRRSTAMVSYIDSLKTQLISMAGLRLVDGKEVYSEGDFAAVSKLFGKEGKGQELKNRLLGYEDDLLSLDAEMNPLVHDLFVTTASIEDPSESPAKTFEETYFQYTPVIGVIAVLNKFQNDIRVIENQLLVYCREKLSS